MRTRLEEYVLKVKTRREWGKELRDENSICSRLMNAFVASRGEEYYRWVCAGDVTTFGVISRWICDNPNLVEQLTGYFSDYEIIELLSIYETRTDI